MSVMFYNAQTAMATDHACSGHERFSMPNATAASTGMFAAAGTILLTADVVTSVSLFVFVLVIVIVPLILPGLVVLISLLLICLTGLVTLESLVGPEIERMVRTVKGD